MSNPTTENLILLGLIERFMQLYTGYFCSDYSLCAVFSLPMCQERSDDAMMMMMTIITSHYISLLAL